MKKILTIAAILLTFVACEDSILSDSDSETDNTEQTGENNEGNTDEEGCLTTIDFGIFTSETCTTGPDMSKAACDLAEEELTEDESGFDFTTEYTECPADETIACTDEDGFTTKYYGEIFEGETCESLNEE